MSPSDYDAAEAAAFKRELLRRVAREAEQGKQFLLPIHLDLTSLLAVIANLQLSLRHPDNAGPSARIARQLIEEVDVKRIREVAQRLTLAPTGEAV